MSGTPITLSLSTPSTPTTQDLVDEEIKTKRASDSANELTRTEVEDAFAQAKKLTYDVKGWYGERKIAEDKIKKTEEYLASANSSDAKFDLMGNTLASAKNNLDELLEMYENITPQIVQKSTYVNVGEIMKKLKLKADNLKADREGKFKANYNLNYEEESKNKLEQHYTKRMQNVIKRIQQLKTSDNAGLRDLGEAMQKSNLDAMNIHNLKKKRV